MFFIVFPLLCAGEVLVIYAEMSGARLYAQESTGFAPAFMATLVPLLLGAVCLVLGYMLGMKYLQNIWSVTAISFGTILISEPLFDYFYIGQVPGTGATVGIVLGGIGILSVIFL
ncbi:MAG: hypothetical protein KGI73_01835 [Patescibacteria group bacterium]|nr:hypothetical protein [Patescibacteria group bacterium]